MLIRENLAARLAEMKARLHAERLAPARRLRAIAENNAPPVRARARFPRAGDPSIWDNSPAQIRRPRGGEELAAWLSTQAERRREAYAFRDMGRKIERQASEMRRERYVTSILGVRTSWPRIVEHAKYAVCAEAPAR